MGLSLTVTVSPDSISQDGVSEATVTVLARNGNSQPVAGLSLRVEMRVGGAVNDSFGHIVTRSLSTDSAGRATTKYIAPPAPPANSEALEHRITFVVTPIGDNFANATPRTVDLQIVPPGERPGPNGTPVATFVFSPSQPRAHDTVLFDASASNDSDGTIVSYAWAFGDGGSGTGKTVNHQFELAGNYSVTLTVTDDRGKSASKTLEVQVGALVLPTAVFDVSPSAPAVGQNVHVNGSASTAPPGHQIAHYEWFWGDGASSSGITSDHDYGAPGTYTITLRVTDDAGRTASASKTVTVGVGGPGLTADFVFSPTDPAPGSTVVFNAGGSKPPNSRTIVKYEWDFGLGGGFVVGEITAQQVYPAVGTYTITLRVTDDAGTVAVVSKTLTVKTP
jgi:PKD repeat protein